jgi:peptidyl-prolyl cis-trans isomerase C
MMSSIVIIIFMVLISEQAQVLFALAPYFPTSTATASRRCGAFASPLYMGLFDGISKAFNNQDFKSQDQRVRASHILIKGEDSDEVLTTVRNLLGEIQSRVVDGEGDESLSQVFAELARRQSQCPSKDQGGDLGLFGKGKMVKEFDLAIFPDDKSLAPEIGTVVGPVVTDIGIHIILVTGRDENKDQVEEKLARIDPDASR